MLKKIAIIFALITSFSIHVFALDTSICDKFKDQESNNKCLYLMGDSTKGMIAKSEDFFNDPDHQANIQSPNQKVQSNTKKSTVVNKQQHDTLDDFFKSFDTTKKDDNTNQKSEQTNKRTSNDNTFHMRY